MNVASASLVAHVFGLLWPFEHEQFFILTFIYHYASPREAFSTVSVEYTEQLPWNRWVVKRLAQGHLDSTG